MDLRRHPQLPDNLWKSADKVAINLLLNNPVFQLIHFQVYSIQLIPTTKLIRKKITKPISDFQLSLEGNNSKIDDLFSAFIIILVWLYLLLGSILFFSDLNLNPLKNKRRWMKIDGWRVPYIIFINFKDFQYSVIYSNSIAYWWKIFLKAKLFYN